MNRFRLHFAPCWMMIGIIAGCAGQAGMLPDPADNVDTTDSMEPGTVNANIVVFSDPDSEFTTSDVRDIDEQIVQFDGVAKTMIWVDGNIEFPGWAVEGNLLGETQFFQVRFGTKDGEQRAYFTETGTATICNIEVPNGALSITATSTPVPQE